MARLEAERLRLEAQAQARAATLLLATTTERKIKLELTRLETEEQMFLRTSKPGDASPKFYKSKVSSPTSTGKRDTT